MKKLISIVVACGAGGFLGTFTGLHLFSSLSFIGYVVAIITGGVAGYFLYDFERVIEGAKHAWKKVAATKVSLTKKQLFQLEKKRLVFIYSYFSILENSAPEILCAFMATIVLIGTVILNGKHADMPILVMELSAFFLVSFFLPQETGTSRKNIRDLKYFTIVRKYSLGITKETSWFIQILLLNPIVMPAALTAANIYNLCVEIRTHWKAILLWIFKAILWMIYAPFRLLWITLKYGTRFAVLLFKYIHSDRRLLCLCDSALGTAIGMYWHSPIIGMVVGALSGLVSYQLIGIRLMKLQPKH
jgi:hypothetical protein